MAKKYSNLIDKNIQEQIVAIHRQDPALFFMGMSWIIEYGLTNIRRDLTDENIAKAQEDGDFLSVVMRVAKQIADIKGLKAAHIIAYIGNAGDMRDFPR